MSLPSFEPPSLNNCRGGTNCRAVTAITRLMALLIRRFLRAVRKGFASMPASC